MELKPRDFFLNIPGTKLPFPSRWLCLVEPSLSHHAALSHCSTFATVIFAPQIQSAGVPWAQRALGKATPGGLCCRATLRASPQEWMPTTQSWNWEHQSHSCSDTPGECDAEKSLLKKHSHVKAKLEYYTNLNTQKIVFGLLWNSTRTQILGRLT